MIAQSSMESKHWDLKGRVLVVEDDEVMGKWIARKLKNCGLESEWVSDTSSAYKELSAKQYHAVVSDVFLEETMTAGLGLISRLKELDIPVVVITAKADLEVARNCLRSSVHEFIEKPFEIDRLIQSITNAWENPRHLSTLVEHYLDAHGLTETEKKISRLVLKGLSNREIAVVNGNTEKTIKFHMTVIYQKCNVSSRTEFFSSILPT